MEERFDLAAYLSGGIENILRQIVKASHRNPGETAFMLRFAAASAAAGHIRRKRGSEGKAAPAFLIASIATNCNLFCSGCYARANDSCGDHAGRKALLSPERWDSLFSEAAAMGIPFVLLAGGEPMLRPDIIRQAAKHRNILFPLFTNGTLMNSDALRMLKKHRNIKPVLSLEGDGEQTDARRGPGTYDALMTTMTALKAQGILFGVSVTVTRENLAQVTSGAFVAHLAEQGCRAVIYVEYVPVSPETEHLVPNPEERIFLDKQRARLAENQADMIFLSFPGDEQYMGGCLAAGRGFFHISADGSAEPCPFSPYSDITLHTHSLEEALASPLFMKLTTSGILAEDHDGGCLLFRKEAEVRALVSEGPA